MEKLNFYDVDENYINYLKKFDHQVPNVNYSSFNKFVCGIVLKIDEFNYYAPVTSFNKRQKTNILIMDKGQAKASIRFCFMFPAPTEVLKFKDINSEPQHYKDLLNAEIKFCNSNVNKILKKAQQVYKIGSNRNHSLAYTCCDFKKLESKCNEYRQGLEGSREAGKDVAATKDKTESVKRLV